MKRVALTGMALMFIAAFAFGQVSWDERDLGQSGAMSVEELDQEPIVYQLDIPYADDGNPSHRLDLYLPKSRRSPLLPVVVYIHGGGWSQGDKADGAGRLMPLLRTGQYAGVSAGYRLSGEARWPAQILDCKAAIRWVRANAFKYGLDPERIGVWGRNAGAHLALMLGASGGVQDLTGDIGPYKYERSDVAAVVNFFGVSEMLAMIGPPGDIGLSSPNAPEARLIGGSLRENPEKAKAASPVTYVTPSDAPVLTIHGTEDQTVPYDQALRLDAALRKARVPCYLVTVKGAGHGDFGTAADDRVKGFFDKYLRGKRIEVSTAPIDRR